MSTESQQLEGLLCENRSLRARSRALRDESHIMRSDRDRAVQALRDTEKAGAEAEKIYRRSDASFRNAIADGRRFGRDEAYYDLVGWAEPYRSRVITALVWLTRQRRKIGWMLRKWRVK